LRGKARLGCGKLVALKKITSKPLTVAGEGRRSSQQDTKAQKLEAVLDALWKSFYGKRYSSAPEAYDVAKGIEMLRHIVVSPGTLTYQAFEHQDTPLRPWAAKSLLNLAITSTAKLRRVADALDFLDAPFSEQSRDDRQLNIFRAYADCDNNPPTLREVREKFVARFGEQCWPVDFSVRKTLKWVGLPLAKAKRGRPRGSRSQIGNPRRLGQ
jgi:hypothetical protein